MSGDAATPISDALERQTGGAVGAGAVLVLLPTIALICGARSWAELPLVGLPILAIFGIMILFGALALVATLFERLGLSNSAEAFALPEGSIRAAIALALIVLFAIVSIMLYQSTSKPYRVHVIAGLEEAAKAELLKDSSDRVIAVVSECRPDAKQPPTSSAGCDAKNVRYAVHLIQPQGRESTDLATQLLTLIGTLMTSVTSFYFASRAAEPRRPSQADPGGAPEDPAAAPDGCDVPVVSPTADADLPPSRGGTG